MVFSLLFVCLAAALRRIVSGSPFDMLVDAVALFYGLYEWLKAQPAIGQPLKDRVDFVLAQIAVDQQGQVPQHLLERAK
jgi:hypothetical protein